MMFTGPRTMNSYPYQTNHMPSTHYYHPNWEPVPMQTKENSTSPLIHEPWPQYYGCQVPMACPNCSNQGHCPNPYYIRPPFQPLPSPPSHFYGGYYPPYPQPCHVGYVPPPHYIMELPRYEYDKNVPSGFHCCGCPNHNLKEEKGVKIEEHEPDVETKKSGSLVPSGANNFSYPVVWIPSEYGTNKGKFKSADKQVDDNHGKQVSPYVTRPHCVQGEKHEEFPTVLQHQQDYSEPAKQDKTNYGWIPLDMDSLRKLIESGVGVKTRGEEKRNVEGSENKNQHKQFPYNIIWLPYDGQWEKEERIANTAPVGKASSESDHIDHETEKMRTEESGGCSKTIPHVESKEEKEAKQSGCNVKMIPVKQLEEFVQKPTDEFKELKGDEEAKGKGDGECASKGVQSSSPTKKSKLPPICLRVDPPKKKNGIGKGGSRSPSPPGDKKRQSPNDIKTSGECEATQPSKKDIKVEAKDEKPGYDKIEVLHVPQNEKKESISDKSADSKEKAVQADREQTENGQGDTENGHETRMSTKKSLSEMESAIIIQSVYRGHEVRRTEPLKKLKQIAKIRNEVHEVRKCIEELVSSGGNSIDKERVAIGETIMKLLLKLDTIQGLLPSIRDLRKSVAKELIVLQEKLDSITCANEFSKDAIQGEGPECTATISDESSEKSVQDEGSRTKEQVSILSESSHEVDMNVNDIEGDLAYAIREEPSDQPSTSEDLVCDSEKKENLAAAPVSNSPVNGDSESSGPLDEVTISPAPGSPELGAVTTDFNVGEELPEDVSNGMTLENEEETEYMLAELPRGVIDYDDMKKETREKEANMESMLRELPIQVIDDDEANIDILEREGSTFSPTPKAALATAENRNVDVDLLAELPRELPELVVEEQPALGGAESLARVDHEPPSVVSGIDIDVPIAEQDSDEGVVPRDEGPPMRLHEEIKATQSPGIDCCGNEIGNASDQLVSAETVKRESFGNHSESEAQQHNDENETSELSSKSQDVSVETRNEEIDKKIIEENERMKEMIDKLITNGKQQQDLISSLSSKVEDLEKRLAKKKTTKEAKRSRVKVLKSKCGKSSNGLKQRAMGVAS